MILLNLSLELSECAAVFDFLEAPWFSRSFVYNLLPINAQRGSNESLFVLTFYPFKLNPHLKLCLIIILSRIIKWRQSFKEIATFTSIPVPVTFVFLFHLFYPPAIYCWEHHLIHQLFISREYKTSISTCVTTHQSYGSLQILLNSIIL